MDEKLSTYLTMKSALRPISEDQIRARFPDGFTLRDEANAIVAYAFRNGPIETLHAGKDSDLLKNQELSRITDEEMRTLMINACDKVEELLRWKQLYPSEYAAFTLRYNVDYCRKWKR